MRNDYEFRKKWKLPIAISFAILVLASGLLIYHVLDINSRDMSIDGGSKDEKVYVKMDTNALKDERWEASVQMSDDPEDTLLFTGETVNCSIVNDNPYRIKNWNIRINIKDECYLNGFWGGEIEVHQFRDGKEIVETVPKIVSSSEIKNLEVNPYISSMMIHLTKGDFIVFTPNFDNANTIRPHESVAVVLNLYYRGRLDFSSFLLTYRNDMNIRDLWEYRVIMTLWLIYVFAELFFHAILLVNKRILREAHLRDQNISVMTDIYLETHGINLYNKTGYLIKKNNENTMIDFEAADIQECLNSYVENDCYEVYEKDLKGFFDLSTLEERMEESSSIVFEYKSRTIGWVSVRFFKLTKAKDGNQYVLAFQNINEERHKLHKYEEHIRQSENNAFLRGNFMDTIYYALNGMAAGIRMDLETVEASANDEIKLLSKKIGLNVEHLLLLGCFVYDMFALDGDRFQLNPEEYSVQEMADILKDMLKPFYEGRDYEFITDIDGKIPQKLIGDKRRLMQILVVLMSSSMLMTQKGFVKLSIFGKQNGDVEELLISVRDTTDGFNEDQMKEIRAILNESKTDNTQDAVNVYFRIMNQILKKMNSELRIVSAQGSGSEFYFSIDQKIAGDQVTAL